MIYLIDDKRIRQEKDYQWDEPLFNQYIGVIHPIYTLNELKLKSKEIFSENSIILYHESFLDSTHLKEEAASKRHDIETFSKKRNCYVVYFSGSKEFRELAENVAHLPVSVLYNNLKSFLDRYKDGEINLNYLLYGENYKIEEFLYKKLISAIDYVDQTPFEDDNSLFIRPSKNNLHSPLLNTTEKIIFDKVSDKYFTEKINEWLNEKEYKRIFVPISLGKTLADFNGLRCAIHIRCTKSLNQLKPIYLYSYVSIEHLVENKYFDILKTKNVFLIDYKKESFYHSLESIEPMKQNDLYSEMRKISLKLPKSYFDDHSIANEWGVFQLAKFGDVGIDTIEGFDINKLQNLYFKYLITINELDDLHKVVIKEEQKQYAERLKGPKVIGKIELSKIK